jgi:long-subunit fatty acid transport protein
MKYHQTFFLLLLSAYLLHHSTFITAQDHLGSWNIINVKMELNNKWSLFGEAQIRSLKFYNNFHYYEYKAGIQYKITNEFSLVAGVGDYDTYAAGGDFKTPMANDETRTWLQFNINQYLHRLKWEHRYRAEQRWTNAGFRNRFRYRLGTLLPINKQKITANTFYVYAWNELFFTNKAPYFERNRFSAGGGYELNDRFSLQLG